MTSLYDSILFDFDGVLADSEPLHWACWSETLAPLGIDLDWETYCGNCVGVADRNMVEYFARLSKRPIEAAELRTHYPRKKQLFTARVRENNPCVMATAEWLRTLEGYRLAVVSSSARAEVEPLLRSAGILDAFEATVFGDDVERHKPAPDPYLLAAGKLDARRPLVVEDSAAGVASARAAGFDVIRVASPGEVAAVVTAKLSLL